MFPGEDIGEEMEMPTPCQHCGKWFDLNDGYRSDKWYPKTIICEECHSEEEIEIDRDEEIENLRYEIDDAQSTIKINNQRLEEIKTQFPDYQFPDPE